MIEIQKKRLERREYREKKIEKEKLKKLKSILPISETNEEDEDSSSEITIQSGTGFYPRKQKARRIDSGGTSVQSS